MNSAIFWNITQCSATFFTLVSCKAYSSTLKTEATYFSKSRSHFIGIHGVISKKTELFYQFSCMCELSSLHFDYINRYFLLLFIHVHKRRVATFHIFSYSIWSLSPQRCLHLVVVMGLVRLCDPKSNARGSLTTSRATQAVRSKGRVQTKRDTLVLQDGGWACGLITPSCKK
jgi:hypothetical protein